jgi:hypothetical protein
LIKEALEEISEELIGLLGTQANILEHAHDFLQDLSILSEERLIMDIEEGKVIVGVKLLLTEVL